VKANRVKTQKNPSPFIGTDGLISTFCLSFLSFPGLTGPD